jgi:hypothetical protein
MSPEVFPSCTTFDETFDYMVGDEHGRHVEHVGMRNIYSLATAKTELEAMAGLSATCSKPAIKFAIKYPAGIRITPSMAERDVDRCCAALGLENNLVFFALHKKNSNYDIHILANIVEPTGRCTRMPFRLQTLYQLCATISRERKWAVTPNRFNGEPHTDQSASKTRATYYSSEKGEIPWSEAIFPYVRHAINNSCDFSQFFKRISVRGISIKLELKNYKDGIQRPNLYYHLVDYPHIKCNATSISPEAKFESLVKKFGDFPKDYLLYLPERNTYARARTNKDLYGAAGRVLEREVADRRVDVTPHERELIVAREKMRKLWRYLRAELSRDLHEPLSHLWVAEQQTRSGETRIRRDVKKTESDRIRTLPAGDRPDARFQLEALLRDLYRRQRVNASRRWKGARQALAAKYPFLGLDFFEFVRQELANPNARIVHRDHVARGLVGSKQDSLVPPQRQVVTPKETVRRAVPIPRQGPVQS